MTYTVKEIFKTLQGEGGQAGRAAVFCRFSGCNLWSGREEDRADATCNFCDTDFVGGDKFANAETLCRAITECWGDSTTRRLVVFTGGEPLLQLDDALIKAVHAAGFEIALETNGTLPAPSVIDWICVSPKAKAKLVQKSGKELKLIYPQDGVSPADFEQMDFEHFFLQPMDNANREQNTAMAVEYCINNPRWRISLQTHKLMGIR
ncbi:MAG: 7-carboxy-7-deazaguanine synthase [Alphaproteobacteria bacterium]|nr:7-carboxy-7-deazaguanine synthase [Alphaproteobacteria bacterium]